MMNVWIYRAVKPAARVMDRLRFPRKLLTMAAVFLVPAVLCTALLTSVLQRDIGFVQRELRGTSAEQPLTDLVVAVERHRGLMARQLNGDTTLGADIANQTDRIDAGFAALAAWSRADGAVLHVDDQLAAAAAAWSQLKQSSSPDAAKADDAHVELLDKLVDLSGAIADASNLTLDPEMSTYALMDLTTGRALRATRTIGALRDYGAVTLNAGTALDAQMLGRLMMSYGAARDEFKPLGSDLQRALQADTGVAEALDGKLKAATDAANAFLALTKAQIVDVTKAGVSGKDYFEAGSRAVTAIGDLSAAATPQLTRLLQLRLHAATQRLYLALAVSAAAGLLAVYLYYGFLRSLSATVRGLRRATTQITQRQYPGNIDLFSTDEMQEIAGELEKIAAALKHSEAEQKLRLDEAAKLKTSLDVASVGVMFANVDGIIEFANGSAVRMFDAAAEQVRKLDPAFDAAQLVGRSFDLFHRDREHQRRLLATLQETYRTRVRIGSGIYDIAVSPVFGSEGQRLGAVIEWIDRTAQVSVDEQMEKLVEAAAEGDFSGRIVADKLDAGLRKRADALNKLMEAVSGGLQDLDRVLSAIADGDLTQTVERQGKGLFGKLYGNANSTVRQLAQAVGQMKLAAESVKVASGEISAGNADLSRRTEQQAASLEETASSMEQLTSTVKQNADNALQATQLARGASEVAVKGGALVGDVVEKMSAIEQSSRKVAEILSVIDGIAFQTNILALNAAVEAARAGEQGRGFGVVAGEVRSLAQRAGAAAKEIKTLITDSGDKVEAGAQLVNTAGQTMTEIVTAIKRVTDIMNEISAASIEQSSGIEQVNQAITNMDEVTQQNAALVEEASASARSLEEQAQMLASSVSVFRIEARKAAGADKSRTASAAATASRTGKNPPRAAAATPQPQPARPEKAAPEKVAAKAEPSKPQTAKPESASAAAARSERRRPGRPFTPPKRQSLPVETNDDQQWQEF